MIPKLNQKFRRHPARVAARRLLPCENCPTAPFTSAQPVPQALILDAPKVTAAPRFGGFVRAVMALGLGATTLTACGSSQGTTAPTSTPSSSTPSATVTTPQSEAAAVKNMKWTANVTVTTSGSSWTFRSPGIPSSQFVAAYYAVPQNPLAVSAAGATLTPSSTAIKNRNYNYTLPLTPTWSTTTTAAPLGPIGVMLDGAVLYNPFEAGPAKTPALSDNFTVTQNGNTGSFLDSCNSHPNQMDFHYHGLATCLVEYATGQSVSVGPVTSSTGSTTAAVSETNAAAKKPVELGFAFDGYAIYDNIAMNGSTIPVASLDACNGIFSAVPGYPQGIYHYVLENVKTSQSSINCFHGVVSSAYTQALKNALPATGGGPGPPSGSAAGPANANEDAFLMKKLKNLSLYSPC